MSTFCYRIRGTDDKLRSSGMFHADDWNDAAEKVAYGLSVHPRSNVDWVDKTGVTVRVTLSVCPDQTTYGVKLLEERDRKERELRKLAEAREERLRDQLEGEIARLGGIETVLEKLKNT